MGVDEMKEMKLNKIRCRQNGSRRNGSKSSKATAYQTELGKYGAWLNRSYIPQMKHHKLEGQMMFFLENVIYLLDVASSNLLSHPIITFTDSNIIGASMSMPHTSQFNLNVHT